jgi:D-alanyl-D-alanine dipeptidase
MKNTCFVLIIACGYALSINTGRAQSAVAVRKNQYGLQVINDVKAYCQTVSADSNKRMVLLRQYISPLIVDFKYATKNNFTHSVLYHRPELFARLPVAKALQKVEEALKEKGLGLKFFDAYRPYSVTEKMWKIVPDERYAASPAKGSGHNRGIAVDVTLIDLKTGAELPMPTAFDDFSDKAHHDYMQLDSAVKANRSLLKAVMGQYGFTALSTEWWHYFIENYSEDELLDINFDLLNKSCSGF